MLPFFDGLELVEPGLVYVREWRPDNPFPPERPDKAWVIVGAGHKAGYRRRTLAPARHRPYGGCRRAGAGITPR